MSIIDAALSRSRTVIGLLVFILIAGAFAYNDIPKESDPDVNIPIIYTKMHHEGISPEDAERLLVRPMETELRSIEGVKEMRSLAFEGGASVLLEFDAGFDADVALDDVREKVDLAKPDLPSDTDEPEVHEINLSLFPVLSVTLSGPVQERTLLRLARDLQDAIEAIPAVLEANIVGDRNEAVELIIDPVQMQSYGIDARNLLEQVARSNLLVAAGTLDTGAGRFGIKVPGLFEDARDILNMPVKADGDAVVTVGDVTEIKRTFKDPLTFARVNGQRALVIEVSKRTGENIIDTIEQVRASVLAASADWPEEVEIGFSQDQSTNIRQMLSDLQNNILSAVLLVMIVVVASLGLRGGLLVGIAIPGSFLAGILVLYLGGLTVNIVVLFSLILAVGMLVDGAIVVTEYADRKLAEGASKAQAYSLAAKRMAWPIIASTATTLAAFTPLLFWPGLSGEFMRFLPITLIATLSASLVMALVFVPVLGANLAIVVRFVTAIAFALIVAGIGEGLALLAGLAGLSAAMIALAFGIVGLWGGMRLGALASRLLDSGRQEAGEAALLSGDADAEDLSKVGGFTGAYLWLLKGALNRPVIILFCAVGTLIGSYAAYGMFGRGVEFFPAIEPERLAINIHARGNMSVFERDYLVREVEQSILDIQAEHGEFKSIYTSSGKFETRDDEAEDIIGKIQLEFIDWADRRSAAVIKDEIRDRTGDLAGIDVEVQQTARGPQRGKPIHLELSASDPALLNSAVEVVRQRLETVEGLRDIEDSRPVPGITWELKVDRAQASKFGVDVSLIGSFVQLVTKGLKVSDFRPDDADDEVDILARFPEEKRSLDQLDSIRIGAGAGLIPVGNFVERVAEPTTGILRRTDARRIAFVKADVDDGVNADAKVTAIKEWVAAANLPAGLEITFKGEDKEQNDARDFLVKAFIVALFLMAIILVTQFNSFYSALLILSAVVMSTVGVMLGLLIIQQPFGIIMSGVGVIALAGIVVNNNIVLIDTFDRLRKTESDVRLAILKTGAQRLRPVMLTTGTTILGLLPMVMQVNIDFISREVQVGAPSTQWWVQLATAIVCGLAFATILTLLVTPSLLMLRGNFQAWRARRQAAKTPVNGAAEPGPAE